MATTKKDELIQIKPIEMQTVELRIVGDSPIIMHAWDAKAKRQILEKELNITKTNAREAKSPVGDFIASMYWLTPMPESLDQEGLDTAIANGAKFGFPVTAFKQAAISAAYRMGWTKDKMSLRGAFFIKGESDGHYAGDLVIAPDGKSINIVPNVFKKNEMIAITSDAPAMREDMVRVGMGAADIRYRGEFCNWEAKMTVMFNKNGQYSLEQIINIINAGGSVCGVGEWRPEKDGQYGMFHVTN